MREMHKWRRHHRHAHTYAPVCASGGEGDDYARRKHASCAHVCARMGPYASQVEKATTTRDASSALPSGKSAKAEAATRPAPTGACSVSICAFVPVNQLN